MELIRLNETDKTSLKALFLSVFTQEPWNDDWSDKDQFDRYIDDLTGNPNSLSFGLEENGELIGAALGSIRHWFSGTEYVLDEFFIRTDLQGQGCGSTFLNLIEESLRKKDIRRIFLQTERNVPAYAFYQKNGFHELKDHVTFVKRF